MWKSAVGGEARTGVPWSCFDDEADIAVDWNKTEQDVICLFTRVSQVHGKLPHII